MEDGKTTVVFNIEPNVTQNLKKIVISSHGFVWFYIYIYISSDILKSGWIHLWCLGYIGKEGRIVLPASFVLPVDESQ